MEVSSKTRVRLLPGFKFIVGSGILTSSVSLSRDVTGIYFLYWEFGSRFMCAVFEKEKKKMITCYVPALMWQLWRKPRSDSLSFEHIIRMPAPASWLMPFSSRCPCPFWPAQKAYMPASFISSQTTHPPPPVSAVALPWTPVVLTVCLPQLQPDISSLMWIIIFYILSPEIGCEFHPSRRIFPPFFKNEMSP